MNNFAKTVMWSVLTNRRHYTNNFMMLALVLFLNFGFISGMFNLYRNGFTSYDQDTMAMMAGSIIILAAAIIASQICNDLQTKQQRTQYLMLPATTIHKFWSRILIAFVQSFVLSIAAMIVADIVQILVSLIFTGDFVSATAGCWDIACRFFEHWDDSFQNSEYYTANYILQGIGLLSFATWSFSSYILGGFLFKKTPFLFTVLGWIIFWIVVAMGAVSLVAYTLDNVGYVRIDYWFDEELAGNILTSVLGIVFTTLNMWLSYVIFRRLPIVTGKWFNI